MDGYYGKVILRDWKRGIYPPDIQHVIVQISFDGHRAEQES